MTRRASIVIAVLLVCGATFLLIRKGYSLPWTGFGPRVDSDGKAIPAKTLWDWLDLLLVPLLLALAAWWLEGSRKASELRVELDRQRQKTLDNYLESMNQMLVQQKLPGQASGAARSIARTRTLAAVRSLDGGRKAQVLQFLYEAGLIGSDPVVQLNGADFSHAELDEAVLRHAELRGVHFQFASLRNSTLVDADLRGSDFTRADFGGADLERTNFTQAILTDAIVSREALASAITDQAILPRRR
jgi:hypothetical protein